VQSGVTYQTTAGQIAGLYSGAGTSLPSATTSQLYGGTGAAGVAQPVSVGTGLTLNPTTHTLALTTPPSVASYVRSSFTATAGQTVFSVTYTVGLAQVYVNGVLLNSVDYTANNGTSVVLNVACLIGDLVEVIAFNNATAFLARFQSYGLGINIKEFGVIGDGVTDDTAAIQTAWDYCAANKLNCYAPPGTYICNAASVPTNLVFSGSGIDITIFKRSNSSTVYAVILAGPATNFALSNFTLDGNKANNTLSGDGFQSNGCWNFTLDNIKAINSKVAAAGLGVGFHVLNTADGVNNTRSVARNCIATGNDVDGFFLGDSKNFTIENGNFSFNGENGINAQTFASVDTVGSQSNISIVGNITTGNSGAGIACGNIRDLGNWDSSQDPSQNFIIENNRISSNGSYGLVFAGGGASIVSNIVTGNATVTSFGGALLNGAYMTVTGNVFRNNVGGGIDAGLAQFSIFSANEFVENTYLHLNLGAAQGCKVTGNMFRGDVTVMLSLGYVDGASSSQLFRNYTAWNTVNENTFVFSTGTAINLYGSQLVIIKDNYYITSATNNCLLGAYTGPVDISGNKLPTSGVFFPFTAASTVVIDDILDRIFITGSGNVNSIIPSTTNSSSQKVVFATVTSFGSGYTPNAQYNLTFTGGGGSGASGIAQTNTAGQIKVAEIRNYGSGYTSTPTIGIAFPGSGTGAVIAAQVGTSAAIDGREITVYVNSGITLKNGTGNLSLGADIVGIQLIKLLGYNSTWNRIA
jgi:hypothetical protein